VQSPDDYARWVLATPRPTELLRPQHSYFICATPRCGSWLLCGLLASTGVAGRPHEWFWRDTQESLMRAWGAADFESYLELVLTAGATRNGVFAAKVMWGHLPELSPFPEPRFVWLRRRDRIAQAVSFAKAVQTGHWHHWDPKPRHAPTFRFEEVDALLKEVDDQERRWTEWFAREGIEPLEVIYETLCAEPEAETSRVLDFLSLELPAGASIRALTQGQSDAIDADWAAGYRATAAVRGAPV
jgi:trehalose 2-sulfotransferase